MHQPAQQHHTDLRIAIRLRQSAQVWRRPYIHRINDEAEQAAVPTQDMTERRQSKATLTHYAKSFLEHKHNKTSNVRTKVTRRRMRCILSYVACKALRRFRTPHTRHMLDEGGGGVVIQHKNVFISTNLSETVLILRIIQ